MQFRFEPERVEHPRAVRSDLDAGADLFQFGRLLINLNIDTAPQQRKRSSQPAADAAADDNDRIR